MTGSLDFTKHHGLGNDFLVAFVDEVPADSAALARHVCDRHTGIGADGLILASPGANDREVGFILHNADGSAAEVSGNGLRCFGQAVAMRWDVEHLDIEAVTPAGRRRVVIANDGTARTVRASVEMGGAGAGIELPDDLVARLADTGRALGGLAEIQRWGSIDLGNPHVVFDVAQLGAVQIDRFGRAVEELLGPINVEVIKVNDRGRLDMHVWERGVGVTQACGSGACASAVAAHGWDLVDDRVEVAMPGGSAWVETDGDQIVLTGPSTYIGRVEVPRG